MAPHDNDPGDTQPVRWSLKDLQESQARLERNEQLNLSKRLANTEVRLTQLSIEVQEALIRMTAGLNMVSNESIAVVKMLTEQFSVICREVQALRSDAAWKAEP